MKFTLQSLSKILKTCKENGVAKFKSGDIELSFHPPIREAEPKAPTAISPEENSRVQSKDNEVQQLRRDVNLLEDDEAMMLLENPKEFESRLARGELDEEMHN